MTDNDIIKALECCASWGCETSCADCPLHDTGCLHFSKFGEALDLINRQKAEVERLEQENFDRSLTVETWKCEAVKEFAERLKTKKHECGCNFRKKPVFAVTEEKIDNLVKEMVGEG